jgi:XTP/dITP diphosphohydrolase
MAHFVSMNDLKLFESAEESGSDFASNAWIKASFAFARTGLTCIADDSGIEVDALDGAPGVHSSRFAGESASDQDNNAKLLQALKGMPDEKRKARFVSEIALIAADGSQLAARGTCEGHIAHTPRGSGGFGYDCIFIPDEPGDGRTMAELLPEEKNAISHRGRALEILRAKILSNPYFVVYQDEGLSTDVNLAYPKTELAVFDFDGTLLDGASPVRLVKQLLAKGYMSVATGAKIARWAVRYKMKRPVEQTEVRGYVFESMSQLTAAQAQDLMVELYESELKPLLKQEGLKTIERLHSQGVRVVLVSASFTPIISRLAADIGADFFVCTEMEIADGSYTGRVMLAPPEGINKLLQLRDKADALYGEGQWVIGSAFGDHLSDAPILSAALKPHAVDPDWSLKALANKLNWTICDWE